MYCAVCHRKMQGQYSHGVPYYRCRFPTEYALANRVDHPRNVIMRENAVTGPLDAWLAGVFAPGRRQATIEQLVANQPVSRPDPGISRLRDLIKECDTRLERYRATLDAGADPVLVTGWITQTMTERTRAQKQLHEHTSPQTQPVPATTQNIADLLDSLGDLVTALTEADPEDKSELYRQLGLRLTYDPETQTVYAEIVPDVHRWEKVRVQGGT